MTDKTSSVGGTPHHEHAPKHPAHNKKKFDDAMEAPATSEDKSDSAAGGYTMIKKMLPGITEKEAAAFMKTLLNNLASEFKKAAAKSKENMRKWQEDDQG
ncbi:MAG: hypothetical protein ACOYK9_03260 [Chlamydiia bacterium]